MTPELRGALYSLDPVAQLGAKEVCGIPRACMDQAFWLTTTLFVRLQMEAFDTAQAAEAAGTPAPTAAAGDPKPADAPPPPGTGTGTAATAATGGDASGTTDEAASNNPSPRKSRKRKFRIIPLELQRLFTQLQHVNKVRTSPVSAAALVSTHLHWPCVVLFLVAAASH